MSSLYWNPWLSWNIFWFLSTHRTFSHQIYTLSIHISFNTYIHIYIDNPRKNNPSQVNQAEQWWWLWAASLLHSAQSNHQSNFPLESLLLTNAVAMWVAVVPPIPSRGLHHLRQERSSSSSSSSSSIPNNTSSSISSSNCEGNKFTYVTD